MFKRKVKETKSFQRKTKEPKTKEKKPVFKRTKMPVKSKISHPLGGYLPFPPKDCLKREFFTWCQGTVWIDLSICHSCTNKPECSTRKEYLQELNEKRKAYFADKYPKKETK